MISQRTRGLQHTLLACQAILSVIVLVVCSVITFTFFTSASLLHLERYPFYAAAVIFGLIIESVNGGGTKLRMNLFQRSFLNQHQITFRQFIYATGVLLFYLVVMKDAFISRIFLAVYLPSLYAALLASNYLLPQMLAKRIFRGAREERMLLIGSDSKAEKLSAWMKIKENFGFRIVGCLGDRNGSSSSIEGFQRLGYVEDVEEVITKHKITLVILLEIPDDSAAHQQLVEVLEKYGVRLLILSNLEEKLHHPVVHIQDGGFNFITLRQEPLEDPLNRILKRMLDMVVTLPVLIFVLPPLCLMVWILQRLQSPGPLFYRQTRAGLQNHEFPMLKFRTMHVNNGDPARQASLHDERIYPAGRWLRRFSLDELPQFWNVFKGQMSVIGPRPHLVKHNEQFALQMANYHIRAFVKPGITGLAQVRGFRGEARSIDQIRHRIESDIAYLENWRLVLDASIIVRTAWQMVFPPKTAY